MKYLLLSAFLLAACGSTDAAHLKDNPSGPKAHYVVVKDPARTMKVIKDGTLDVELKGEAADINYLVHVILVGTRQGIETLPVPPAYWTDAWWEALRRDKHFESANYKIDYLGQEITLGYTCDKIQIYDIKTQGSLTALNVKMAIAPHWVLPGLGAATIDMSGKMNGKDFFLGADYR